MTEVGLAGRPLRSAVVRGAGVVAVAVGAVVMPLSAQYRAAPADTLRYAELTRGRVAMAMPSDTVVIRSLHEAVVAVTFPSPGQGRAWYDSLALESEGPMGADRPATATLLRQPFTFAFAPTGWVEQVRAPDIPADVAAITDLTRQFDDFFITVPSGGLRVGARWSDTVENSAAGRETDRTTTRHVRSYVAERDTVVAGVDAVLIQVQQTVEIASESDLRDQNLRVSTRVTGTEDGWALFAPGAGRLLERHRRGSLAGQLTMQPDGATPASISQRYTYESRLVLRP